MSRKPHVFPGAVLAANHDGTLATVDDGKVRWCPRCGKDGHIHRLLSPDERPDGSVGPDIHYACCNCGFIDEDDREVRREWT